MEMFIVELVLVVLMWMVGVGVFFSTEGPQDINTFGKVPQEVRPPYTEGSQDKDLGKEQQCRTPKLPMLNAEGSQAKKEKTR
jgi:hypothetical protein